MMGSNGGEVDLPTVFNAIQTLYAPNSAPNDKRAASSYLEEFQKSVHAWTLADQLLYQGQDLNTRYFGAQTLRTKIQTSFHELPTDAYLSLRDSLLQHIANITSTTENSIVNQLCLAVAQLVLQSTAWADPIGQLLHRFGQNPINWFPLLEILSFIPEEVHSRKLQLGDNRRNQITTQLEGVAQTILAFIKQCLASCMSGAVVSVGAPVELISIGVLNCYKSWVHMNPEAFCGDRPGDVLGFAINQLRVGKCGMRMHYVSMDCVCAIIEVLPELDANSRANNNSSSELNALQLEIFQALLSFEEAYHLSVAEEDQEKTQNYCRIFTDYAESMIDQMLKSWRTPHYSIRAIDLVLVCDGHHEYEMAELTFNFWYRFSEDLYHAHDNSLNTLFRPYVIRFIQSLYRHCYIEPDHEGPLTHNDEFYDFRKRASELVEDLVFCVGDLQVFNDLGQQIMRSDAHWYAQESALFLLHAVSRTIDPENSDIVEPIVSRVLSWTDWRHIALRMAAVRFIGGMSKWFSKHNEDYVVRAMSFLASSLEFPDLCNVAGAALFNVCSACADQIAPRHFDSLLSLLQQMDIHSVDNDAVVGLLRGVGHVVGSLPNERVTQTIRQICWAQLTPLGQLAQQTTENATCQRNTKQDPAYWLDRLSALYRSTLIDKQEGQLHPCSPAICEDAWPVLSLVCDKYQADSRIMERVCRCLRYAIRCVGGDAQPLLPPIVTQLVNIYQRHRHSCLLYLGSVLVDEYGSNDQCVGGLVSMLEAFYTPTFTMLSEPGGLRSYPDTVDDFFRLCSRYLQRCPIQLIKSPVLLSIFQLSLQGIHLDHREANSSVFKFLHEFVHQGKRRADKADQESCFIREHVRSHLGQQGPLLVHGGLTAVIFSIPSPLMIGACDLFYELKEFMPAEFSVWFGEALKSLPTTSTRGNQYATLEQLENLHKQVLSCRGGKEMSRYVKEFCRLFR